MLLNTEKRIHVRLRETKVERKKKKNPFSGAARAQVRPTFSLRIGSREERRPRDRLLAPWAEGRGPDEENEEDERPERGTDRSARERNPRLPWLPSHSRLASLPWRWRHPFPQLSSPLLSFRSLAFSAPLACRPTLSQSRNSVLLALGRQSSLWRQGATRSLALASSFLRGGYHSAPRREGGRKRGTDGGDSPRTCTHAWYLVLRNIEARMHLQNDSITYQTQVTRNLVMYFRAMLIYGVREDLDASWRRSTWCRLLQDRVRVITEWNNENPILRNPFVIKKSLIYSIIFFLRHRGLFDLDFTYIRCLAYKIVILWLSFYNWALERINRVSSELSIFYAVCYIC